MAWKTPGVYFTEIDNTEYQNPAAEINTTVAIIGFAKKGPIGVPTEITTYNDYKSKFGTPIDGQYAGLAIRNILSAGGTVLFTRVADTTIASKSNVVLKNGSEATNGMLVINKTSDFTADMMGYELSTVYAGKITTASGKAKNLILRTPSEGKLKLSKMFEQFKDGLLANSGYDEFKVAKEIRTSSIRNFNLSVKAEGNDGGVLNVQNYGPYFVDVVGNDKGNGNIGNTLTNLNYLFDGSGKKMKTNAYQKLYVLGAYTNSNSNDDINEDGLQVFDSNKDVFKNQMSYRLYLDKNRPSKQFQLTLTKTVNGITTAIPMRVELTGESDANGINYTISLADIAETLTKAFEAKNQHIIVKYCYNPNVDTQNAVYGLNSNASPYLLFVSMDEDIESFDVSPYILEGTGEISQNTLFMPTIEANENDLGFGYNDEDTLDARCEKYPDSATTCFATVEGVVGNYDISSAIKKCKLNAETVTEAILGAEEPLFAADYKCLYVAKKACVAQKSDLPADLISVVHEEKTSSFKFVFNCGEDYKYKNSEVVVGKTEFGGYLFAASEADEAKMDVYLKNDNYNAIGSHLASVTGEDGIDDVMKVAIIDGHISFFEEGNTIPGDFEATDIVGYEALSDLIGDVVTEETYAAQNYTLEDACVISKEGSPELDASKQDIIVFTAREYGEGTRDIGVTVRTSISPIDGSETHYISTVVNGTVKETWEDVSYEPSDENYFVNLINEEPENNGSSYIKVDVIKKNTSKSAIGISDTEVYTGDPDMPVYLGKPLSSDSINRLEANARESEYEKYDYVVGNNGVPEDTTDLFVDAMDTLNSGLCNKDLYVWHILITPDNISEEVQDAAINLVEFMEDAIYIVDPPQGLSRDKVIKWHNGKFLRGSALQSNYACTYWPWCKLYDSTAGKYVWAMPSVVMAAQFCKTDNWYAPWYAPAGETCGLMSSVLDIEEYPNKNDRDQLYLDQNRINPFLKLKNGNILAFGEKTTQRKNSTLTKIHTRRMLIALKHDLRNAIKGFLFLPTMTENIAKIRGIVTSIMEEVKVGGGVASYVVVCDETNNTTETLQQDILNIAVSCVPTGCIEQVEITFTLNKSAETVS